MRKLSELIQICMPFHFCWGGQEFGMCTAACSAWENSLISGDERNKVQDYCSALARQYGPYCYLKNSVSEKLGHMQNPSSKYPPEVILEIRNIYENEIKTLKQQGN